MKFYGEEMYLLTRTLRVLFLRTLLICMFYEIIYTHARKCDDLSLKSR